MAAGIYLTFGACLAFLAFWLNARSPDPAGPMLCANGAAILLGFGLAAALGAFDSP